MDSIVGMWVSGFLIGAVVVGLIWLYVYVQNNVEEVTNESNKPNKEKHGN